MEEADAPPHEEVACARPWVAQQASHLPGEAACVLLAEVVAPHVEVACACPWVAQQVSRLPAEAVCARPGEASLLPPGALDDPQHLRWAEHTSER